MHIFIKSPFEFFILIYFSYFYFSKSSKWIELFSIINVEKYLK